MRTSRRKRAGRAEESGPHLKGYGEFDDPHGYNAFNESYKSLLDELDDKRRAKARAMQRAWVAYRDTSCGFYYDKIQGTMANMMIAACSAREYGAASDVAEFLQQALIIRRARL